MQHRGRPVEKAPSVAEGFFFGPQERNGRVLSPISEREKETPHVNFYATFGEAFSLLRRGVPGRMPGDLWSDFITCCDCRFFLKNLFCCPGCTGWHRPCKIPVE